MKLNKDKKIVGLTFGAFNPGHYGHVNLFRNAKKHCDLLIVCVSDDAYIREIKGDEPFVSFEERMVFLDAIKYVDSVVPQTLNFGKKAAVKMFNPDILFVGNDWTPETYTGEGLGVPVMYLPYTSEISSTMLRGE